MLNKKEVLEDIDERLSLFPVVEREKENKVSYYDDDSVYCVSFMMPAILSIGDFLGLYDLEYVIDVVYVPMLKFNMDEESIMDLEETFDENFDIVYNVQIFLEVPIENWLDEGEVIYLNDE